MRVVLGSILLVFWVVVGGIGLSACSKAKPPTSQMDIEVRQPSTDDGEWKVTWRVSSPVRGLRFTRQKDGFRSRSWKTVTPDTSIQLIGGEEYLVSSTATQEFTVQFREQAIEVFNDYPFLIPFSDGGAVLYSGHLRAEPFNCARADCLGSGHLPLTLGSQATKFIARPGHHLMIGTDQFEPAASVAGDYDGVAYFGKLQATKGNGFSAVLDPKLPKWLTKDLEQQMPRLLNLYQRRLGFPLEETPVIYFPYSLPAYDKIIRSSGGVIGKQMFLSIEGGAWSRKNLRREEFLRLLAHETVHLWNANRFHSPDQPGGAWLHEGSAEALSARALMDLGLITRSRFVDLQSEALNRCIVGRDMKGGVGPDSARRDLRSYYDCGHAMHTLLQASASLDPARGFSIYSLWSDVFQRAANAKNTYTHEDFFEAATLASSPSLVGHLQAFTNNGTGPSDAFFLDRFSELGISVSTWVADFPRWYKTLISQRAVELLIDHDCNGKGYYALVDGGVELIGNNTCENLRTNFRVTAVEDFPLIDQGVQAYDHLRQICSNASGEVIFRHPDGYLSLPCVSMPPRPRFLWLQPDQLRARLLTPLSM